MDYSLYNPVCPNCGTELEFDDHYDMYDDGDLILCFAYGHCPNCKKKYQWKDIYSFRGFDDLEETD